MQKYRIDDKANKHGGGYGYWSTREEERWGRIDKG